MSEEERTPKSTALLLIDVQNDFIDGSLAVKDARQILPVVHELLDMEWDMVVGSQDFHPSSHISFASTHAVEPFQLRNVPHPHIKGETVPQMMWPDHCVQGTRGCELEASVMQKLAQLKGGWHLVRKGIRKGVDGYSAFSNNHYVGFTPLASLLFSGGRSNSLPPNAYSHSTPKISAPIDTVVIAGLATDFCVLSTAIDARKFGLRTIVVRNGVRGVDMAGCEDAIARMKEWGCRIVDLEELKAALEERL